MAEAVSERAARRKRTGVVLRASMNKTVVVQVENLVRDRQYTKYRKARKKYLVHDPKSECRPGDKVTIVEARPISKLKRWRVAAIMKDQTG